MLRELRESRNLMQREIGAIIEVDGAFISKIEHNDKTINRQHLRKLSEFFNVKEEDLQTIWLADRIRLIIKDEIHAEAAIKMVLKDLNEK